MKHMIYAMTAAIALIASQVAFAGVSTDSVKLLLESQSFNDFLTVNEIATGSAAKVADALNGLTGAKGAAIQSAIAKMVTQIGSNTNAANVQSVVQANLVVNGHTAAWSELNSTSLTAAAANVTGAATTPAVNSCSEANTIKAVEAKLPADLASRFEAAIAKERAARGGKISVSEGDCGTGISTYQAPADINYAKIYVEAEEDLGAVTVPNLIKATQDTLKVDPATAAQEVDQFSNGCRIFNLNPQAG